MILLFWHAIYGRIQMWFGIGLPTGRPALWFGVIDAAELQFGQMDADFAFGTIDTTGPNRMGEIDAAPVKLGRMPVRRGA